MQYILVGYLPHLVLPDLAHYSNKIKHLGIWEQLNDPKFKPVEFDGFKMQAGLNSFTMTPKQWIAKTAAIGLTKVSGSTRYDPPYNALIYIQSLKNCLL